VTAFRIEIRLQEVFIVAGLAACCASIDAMVDCGL
jgi:hypothetical protein